MRQSRITIYQVMLAELFICIITALISHRCYDQSLRAYIDPGTGSFFIQAIIAGMAGLTYLLRCYWRSLRDYIPTIFRRKSEVEKKS